MPNESTSGFTDQQLQQIAQIVEQANQSSSDSTVGQVAQALSTAQSAIVQSVPSSVASALDSRSGVAQVVTISSDQWALLSESCRMQNTSTLFTPLLLASLVGMLFFMLFSSGFRHE